MGEAAHMTAELRIAAIGECMIELSELDAGDGRVRLGVAGDTFNTAVYLARALGGEGQVSYLTRLGEDAFSARILAAMQAEGIGTPLIGRDPARLPGLYAIETDEAGERRFHYWRAQSAARRLFAEGAPDLDALDGFDVIHLSGISLAILVPEARAALIDRLAARRAAGAVISFDSNYRPRLWPDAATARAAFAAMWQATTIALPSRDDEAMLHPGESVAEILARIAAAGVREIALKDGAAGPHLRAGGTAVAAGPWPAADRVVDTTGAGDAFDAGYLAARLGGSAPGAAAAAGHDLACRVLAAPGAILPRG